MKMEKKIIKNDTILGREKQLFTTKHHWKVSTVVIFQEKDRLVVPYFSCPVISLLNIFYCTYLLCVVCVYTCRGAHGGESVTFYYVGLVDSYSCYQAVFVEFISPALVCSLLLLYSKLDMKG